jgi:hypothetical protein
VNISIQKIKENKNLNKPNTMETNIREIETIERPLNGQKLDIMNIESAFRHISSNELSSPNHNKTRDKDPNNCDSRFIAPGKIVTLEHFESTFALSIGRFSSSGRLDLNQGGEYESTIRKTIWHWMRKCFIIEAS